MSDALSDDLNTPQAIAALHESANEANRSGDGSISAELLASANLLGLLQHDPEDWFKWQPEGASGLSDADIDALIEDRTAARANKDFATSDRIRDELAEQGVILEDGPDGTTWKRG